MERRIMNDQEKERRTPDDIRTLAINQLERQRNAALELIEQQQAIAADAQDKIEAVNNASDGPTIVLDVDYLDVEYDKYTYYDRVVKTEQFAMNDKSIERTISACADLLHGNKETRLSKVAIEIIVNQTPTSIPLQDITEWQRLLTRRNSTKYGELTDGMYGGK